MKFIPAIDLKENNCVRLQKGDESQTTVYNKDPVEQAKFFQDSGCERIHIVDLDGAFGRENINKETIIKIRKAINTPIELGGGIKNKENISFWFDEGIDFLVVGSLAVNNMELVTLAAKKYTEKIYVALDILDNKIMIKGWTRDSQLCVSDIFDLYNDSLIKGFILTDISRDGMLQGLNINLIKSLIKKSHKNIIVGGGLSNYNDLYSLNKIKNDKLEGVIAGKAFYSGSIEINKSLKILNTNA